MTTVATPAGLLELVGEQLGPTKWVGVGPEQLSQFDEATECGRPRQPAEATETVPSLLLLSLVNLFLPELVSVEEFSAGLNVGLDRVRFPSPAPIGARLRARGEVLAAEEIKGGVQVTVKVSIEHDGGDEAVCVADTVSRFLP